MLSLKMWQNDALISLLEAPSSPDDEKLLSDMMAEAKVDRITAESYLKSWRFNHKEGSIGVILTAVRKNRELEKKVAPATETAVPGKIVVKTPIVVPDDDQPRAKKDPSSGEGIVAAIIKLSDGGMSNSEIIAAGYNKSTVYRQVNEHKKRKKGLML